MPRFLLRSRAARAPREPGRGPAIGDHRERADGRSGDCAHGDTELSALGCKLSLDDFGTGYSSLAYLQRLPMDELKVDRSFIMAMTTDQSAAVVVRSIVKLAHNLGLSVVAEGVESQAAFDALRELGCDVVQGYLLGRPMGPMTSSCGSPRPLGGEPRQRQELTPSRLRLIGTAEAS